MSAPKSQTKKRILLVDDHPLLRQGIGLLINQEPDMTVCGEAEDRAGALAAARKTAPDLAIVDLSLKEEKGLELIKDLRALNPDLLVLVLSMHDEAHYAERVLRAGARGYIMKREATARVLEGIRSVLNGKVFVGERVAARILDQFAGPAKPARPAAVSILSDRELEVLLFVGKGYGSRRIAERLHISIKTVEAHRANIRIKLDLNSPNDLLPEAIRIAHLMGEV